ncbi:MAG: acyl-CoA dehydrogenase family protein [Sphingobium sp.]
MDFSFTDEQRMLRDNLGAYLRTHYGFEARRSSSLSKAGWRPEFWKALANDLGILGAAIPEAHGGYGGGPVELMIIMEEFGSALVLEPFLETVVIAGGVLGRVGGSTADAALTQIVAGDAVIASAWTEASARYRLTDVETIAIADGAGWRLTGCKAVVATAPWATQFLVSARTGGSRADVDGISLFLIDAAAPGLGVTSYPTIDGRRAADVTLDNVAVGADALIGPQGEAGLLIEAAADAAIAALSAEAVGLTRKMLADTVEYTKQRRQFGQPIAAFQVLQHRMVDMYMQTELAASAMYLATLKLDSDPAERALAASAAKVTVANALRFVGQNAVQLHGGMGMTDELAVGHYFKRATVLEHEFGTVDHHLARYDSVSRQKAA